MLGRLLILLLCVLQSLADRPFYLIGHMANSIEDVRDFLRGGANAVESDLSFDKSGTPTVFHHGVPCDCFRSCAKSTDASTFLSAIRDIGIPGHTDYKEYFVLLYIDLKLSSVPSQNYETAGENVANLLLNSFFNTEKMTQIKVVVGLEKLAHSDFFKGFNKKIRLANPSLFDNIGYDIFTSSDNYDDIGKKYSALNITSKIWQTKGITNCLPYKSSKYKPALNERDSSSSLIDKVVVWTLDKESSFKAALDLNVDGIMTNKPLPLYKILLWKKYSTKYHLATKDDDPWSKIIGK